MAFKAGTTTYFALANAANALQNLSPYSDNSGMDQSVAMLDTSTFGSAVANFIPGISSGKVSVSGPYDVTIHTHMTTLISSGSLAGFLYGPGGSVASQARSAGSVYVESFNVNTSAAGRAEYSYSLQITGAIAQGTF